MKVFSIIVLDCESVGHYIWLFFCDVSGFYTVKFFDGVIKTVKGIKVKPFRKEVRSDSLSSNNN